MGSMSASGALGLGFGINVQYRMRRLLPRHAVRVGVK
jgi:hypothetical protein